MSAAVVNGMYQSQNYDAIMIINYNIFINNYWTEAAGQEDICICNAL